MIMLVIRGTPTPVLRISIKTKGLGRGILASISKQGTYKSFVLILMHALVTTVPMMPEADPSEVLEMQNVRL
jgi:hypothetical protein